MLNGRLKRLEKAADGRRSEFPPSPEETPGNRRLWVEAAWRALALWDDDPMPEGVTPAELAEAQAMADWAHQLSNRHMLELRAGEGAADGITESQAIDELSRLTTDEELGRECDDRRARFQVAWALRGRGGEELWDATCTGGLEP